MYYTAVDQYTGNVRGGGSATEKKTHYNHFYSTKIKIKEKKMTDHTVIKSLIPGSPSGQHYIKHLLKMNAIP